MHLYLGLCFGLLQSYKVQICTSDYGSLQLEGVRCLYIVLFVSGGYHITECRFFFNFCATVLCCFDL